MQHSKSLDSGGETGQYEHCSPHNFDDKDVTISLKARGFSKMPNHCMHRLARFHLLQQRYYIELLECRLRSLWWVMTELVVLMLLTVLTVLANQINYFFYFQNDLIIN